MNNSFSSAASSNARITAKKIDMQCQQYLPPLTRGLEYYVLEDKSVYNQLLKGIIIMNPILYYT